MDDHTSTVVKDTPAAKGQDGDFDKEAWAAKKQAERAELFSRSDQIAEQIARGPESLKGALRVMARFPNYSINNTFLIFDQNPHATRVGDYEFWKKKGVQVEKGQKSISILEPGNPYEREDGSIGTSYNVKHVFDIAQTNARPKQPTIPDIRVRLNALAYDSPVEIAESTELPDDTHAIFEESTLTIGVREGLSEPELFRALVVQMAEAYFVSRSKESDSVRLEGDSVMVAFVIAERYGIDSAGLEPTLDGLPEEAEPADVRKALGRIQGAIKDISSRMDEGIREARAHRENEMER